MTTAATRMSTRREATLTSLVGDGRPDARTDSGGSIGTRWQLLKPDQRRISRRSERMSRMTQCRACCPPNRVKWRDQVTRAGLRARELPHAEANAPRPRVWVRNRASEEAVSRDPRNGWGE